MAASTIEKIHPIPGGIYDDTNATTRHANNVGMLPNFDDYGPSVGKRPTAGSWIGLCSVAAINKTPPGYAVLEIKGATGPTAKVRSPLFDHPDGG